MHISTISDSSGTSEVYTITYLIGEWREPVPIVVVMGVIILSLQESGSQSKSN